MATKSKENEVAVRENSALPAYLQGAEKTRIGNIDQSDLIIPRVKLLQAISPEIEQFDNAKQGQFWHTIAGMPLGNEVSIVPIFLRKEYVLWSPRNDDRGILNRAPDGVHWAQPDVQFTVRPKGSPTDVVYHCGKTVKENGLADFGSSVPGDPNSPPAASLTYHMLLLFPDFLDLGPALVLNTRSGVKPAQGLISKTEIRQGPHYAQKFIMRAEKQKSDEGDFFNYNYVSDGYVDEDVFEQAKALYEKYSQLDFRPSDESEDDHAEGGAAKARGNANSSRF